MTFGRRHERDSERPAGAESAVDLAQWGALAQPRRARDVYAEVEVAEGEPLGRDPPRLQFGRDPFRLIAPPPPALLIVLVAQRVQQGIVIRGDPQTREPPVVARVDDHTDVVSRVLGKASRRGIPTRPLPDAEHEARPADTT